MTADLTLERLRALVTTAEHSYIDVPADLPTTVLRRRRRRDRARYALAGLATLGLLAGAAAAAIERVTDRPHLLRTLERREPVTKTLFDVKSGAMEPTLQIGDQLRVESGLLPRYNDVIVFRGGEALSNPGDFQFAKRVLGLGGDTIGCPPSPA